MVARRVSQILLDTEILFRRQNRIVSERELNLVNRRAAFVSEFSECPAKVVWRDALLFQFDELDIRVFDQEFSRENVLHKSRLSRFF